MKTVVNTLAHTITIPGFPPLRDGEGDARTRGARPPMTLKSNEERAVDDEYAARLEQHPAFGTLCLVLKHDAPPSVPHVTNDRRD
jgi:hypothetical protein